MTRARTRKISTAKTAKRCRCSTTTSTTESRKNFAPRSTTLAEDQQAELLAFCWVGQGTYDASDWDEAIAEATDEIAGGGIVDQFLEMPMLASVLEAGMAAFELSCDGVGDLS